MTLEDENSMLLRSMGHESAFDVALHPRSTGTPTAQLQKHKKLATNYLI
jgi:hypothetical protein